MTPGANGQVTAEVPSLLQQVRRLLQGHVELGLLEGRYEVTQRARRSAALAAAAFFGLTAYVFLQVLFVQGLMALGLPAWGACLILFGVYAIVTGVLAGWVGKRDARAGRPFQGSQDEFRRTFEWIRTRLS